MRALRPLREHDLEGVAARGCAPCSARLRARSRPGSASGVSFAAAPATLVRQRRHSAVEQCDDLGRIACEHLGRPSGVVEPHEHVGDDEPALRQPAAGVRQRHRRLELRDVVVAEVADDGLVERLGLLERDEAVAAADERVATEAPLLDGLEQEGGAAGARAGGGRPRAG